MIEFCLRFIVGEFIGAMIMCFVVAGKDKKDE